MQTTDENRTAVAIVRSDFLGLFKGIQEVCLHIHDRGTIIQISSAFKVQVQRTVVHVDGSHYADLVIAYIALGMDEAGRILINAYSCLNQGRIVGLGD